MGGIKKEKRDSEVRVVQDGILDVFRVPLVHDKQGPSRG